METFTTWFDLAEDHGVLELPEHLTSPGPALELHVVISSDGTGTVAWWESDDGGWLGVVDVGLA